MRSSTKLFSVLAVGGVIAASSAAFTAEGVTSPATAPPAAPPTVGTRSEPSIDHRGTQVTFTVLPTVVVHLDQLLRPLTVRTNTLHQPRGSDTWTVVDADGSRIPVAAGIVQAVLDVTASWTDLAFADPAADVPLH